MTLTYDIETKSQNNNTLCVIGGGTTPSNIKELIINQLNPKNEPTIIFDNIELLPQHEQQELINLIQKHTDIPIILGVETLPSKGDLNRMYPDIMYDTFEVYREPQESQKDIEYELVYLKHTLRKAKKENDTNEIKSIRKSISKLKTKLRDNQKKHWL